MAVFKSEKASSPALKELDALTGGHISSAMKRGEFSGDAGEFLSLQLTPKGKVKASKLLLIGAGEKLDYNGNGISIAAGCATRTLRKANVKSLAFDARAEDGVSAAQNTVQGTITSQFELDKYKTKDKNEKAVTKVVVFVSGAKPADLNKGISRGKAIGDSMNFTRDLANEPPNILHPTEMAKRAQAMAKETGLKCEILDEAKMTKLGMGSLMSVSYGSEQPAKMIVLRYTPPKTRKKK